MAETDDGGGFGFSSAESSLSLVFLETENGSPEFEEGNLNCGVLRDSPISTDCIYREVVIPVQKFDDSEGGILSHDVGC